MLDPELVAAWDARLRARLARRLGADRPLGVALGAARESVKVESVAEDGTLAVSSRGMRLSFPWARLSLSDRKALALRLVESQAPEDHAVAAFYVAASGEDAGEHLERAGAAADELRRAFRLPE